MAWTLPHPLGGAATRARLLYERWVLQKVPPWLRRADGGNILSAIGEVADTIVDRHGAGVRLRFPNSDEDALALCGEERRIIRGPLEPAPAYALRVQAWLEAHRRRGSVYTLLEQWHAYNFGAERTIEIVYASGTRYTLASDGTITKDSITWSPGGTGWARAWAFLYEATDPGALTSEEDAVLSLIPRTWSAAHMLPYQIVVMWPEPTPEVRLWDYPPRIWDDGSDWTDDEPVIFEAD